MTATFVLSVWAGLCIAAVFFNYCASSASGNHLDPHRDDGQ